MWCFSMKHSLLWAAVCPQTTPVCSLCFSQACLSSANWKSERERDKERKQRERERERSPKSIPRLEVVTVRRGACCCSAHGTCWHVSLWPAWTRMWSCRGSCPRPLLPWASPARCARRRRSHARSTSPGATAQNARAGPVLLCAGTRGRDGTKINKYTTRGFHTVWF